MFDMIGATLGVALAVQGLIWATLALALPLMWLWMLVDSVLREPADYPHGSTNEKLVWVLLIVFVNWAALPYFFVVFAKRRRSRAATYTTSAPVATA